MRRVFHMICLILTAVCVPVRAEQALPDPLSDLKLYATERFRWSAWNYAESDPYDNSYDLFASQLRAGGRWEHPRAAAHAAWQYAHLWPLPTGASTGAGAGPLYYSNGTLEPESHGTYLKYLELDLKDIGGSGLGIGGGRFDYSSGNMYRTGTGRGTEPTPATAVTKKIEALKKMRVGDRVIGGFGWSEYQRSFDGLKTSLDHEVFHAHFAAFVPTQGGFEEGAGSSIEDIRISALEVALKKERVWPNTEALLFHYHWTDTRALDSAAARPDNTGRSVPAGLENDVDLDMIGGQFVGALPWGPGTADYLVWGGWQTGSWFELDHDAYALAAEAGYQLDRHPWKPWLRGGYNTGSGDSDPADTTHGTFYQMLPTARLYSQSILYNMMNTEDLFVMLIVKPLPAVTVRSDAHFMDLENSSDRWYVGAGPMHRSKLTDYTGRATGGEDELGTLLDLTVTWEIDAHLTLSAYYGHFDGGEVVSRFYTKDDQVDFFSLEAAVRF